MSSLSNIPQSLVTVWLLICYFLFSLVSPCKWIFWLTVCLVKYQNTKIPKYCLWLSLLLIIDGPVVKECQIENVWTLPYIGSIVHMRSTHLNVFERLQSATLRKSNIIAFCIKLQRIWPISIYFFSSGGSDVFL